MLLKQSSNQSDLRIGELFVLIVHKFYEMISDDESDPGFPMQRLNFLPFMQYLTSCDVIIFFLVLVFEHVG